MIQVNRIYLIFNRLVTKKFLVDTSVSEYYTIAILQQNLFYIHTDYQYITAFIKQRIQPYYKIYILLYDTD